MTKVRLIQMLCLLSQTLLMAGICSAGDGKKLAVVIPHRDQAAITQFAYFSQVLELALRKTETTDGPFEITQYPEAFNTERFLSDLKNDTSITVIWTTTNKKRLSELLPIRISLLRELNNYRIFLIRKEDQEIFSRINSLDELRKLRAGLGSHWPETTLLRDNNFNVITSVSFSSLFNMLAAKRFDYFPRGLHEVFTEQNLHKSKGLVVEQHLMLYYNAPFYFFVNKNNKSLADRIERGLLIAQADGSFDQLLLSTLGFKQGYDEQFNKQRVLFKLDSPD